MSVITITKNNLDGLLKTWASIKSQTYSDWEWVVIDGASEDGTVKWLKEFGRSSNIKWVSEPDKGIYHAMNKGIAFATGDYLLFLNAGDKFAASNVLERTIKVLYTLPTRVKFAYGDAFEERDGMCFYEPARDFSWYRKGMFASHQSIFFHKSLFEKFVYDESLHYSGDYALIAAILQMLDPEYILRLSFPVSHIETGGVHFVKRFQVIFGEDWKIRRLVLKQNLAEVTGITILQLIWYVVKKVFPWRWNVIIRQWTTRRRMMDENENKENVWSRDSG